ncbi:MAG: polyprenyl synthetase family protein [Acidimicrobiia bacterium]|nr:polyprenyl synthetase family protein [Acidimicrobiia bacterium]
MGPSRRPVSFNRHEGDRHEGDHPETPEHTVHLDGTTESSASVARMAGHAELADHLYAVERCLAVAIGNPPTLLAESAAHLLFAGGKRIRPALTLICADAYGDVHDDAIDAAAAVELVHLGSLHHDDVIDEAETRRGVPTVNARWSNTVSVLSGDYLLARASEIAASIGAEPARILAWTIGRLTEGEIVELAHLHDTGTDIEHYYEAIQGKTAVLMGSSCHLGALVAGAPEDATSLAAEFGFELGLVFQIVDDVLDLVGDEALTGKKRGVDLVEGVYTLPTLLALDGDDGTLEALLSNRPDGDSVEAAIDLVVRRGGVAGAVEAAARHLARCDALLCEFPPGGPRDALSRLSRYVLARVPNDK